MPPERRSVLKAVGAGITTNTLSGVATASDCDSATPSPIGREYRTPDAVEEVVNDHAGFIRRAYNEGLLSSPEVSVESILDLQEYVSNSQGTYVWGLNHPRGVKTTLITIRRVTPAGEITLSVAPDLKDRKPAIYTQTGPETAEVYRPADAGGGLDKREMRISGERVGDVDTTSSSTATSDSGPSPAGTTATFCTNRGDVNTGCESLDCWAWEGSCCGDNCCSLYDCTGTRCCGGCCCCKDVDHCCEVCGDGVCESDPCAESDISCIDNSCCDCC